MLAECAGNMNPKRSKPMDIEAYRRFIYDRQHSGADRGFEPLFMPDQMFGFQRHLTEWAIRRGRGAIFADCGLGKTLQELTWCENIARKTKKPVLLLTPLAVSAQIVEEGVKFGIDCARSRDGSANSRITITNYEKLHLFNPSDFGGVACDESSILKSFDGTRKAQITEFMRKVEYRLLATATAAPNDYIELGTSSEALGYLGFMDMLARFFKNDHSNVATKRMYGEAPKWRFKGHAELPFWRWVTSWAIACRKPSDLGFDDGPFVLPPLREVEHLVEAKTKADGMLFELPAATLPEQREERKRTIAERAAMAADIVDHNRPAVVWCHMNEEGDQLQKLISNAVQVSGRDDDDAKEEKFAAFSRGDIRVLITKPKIGAWGLNWQHAADIVYFPSHSYEQYYQSVRRCWRFGQKNDVTVNLVITEGERRVIENMKAKARKAEAMFANLVAEMGNAAAIVQKNEYTNQGAMPKWL
jgi:hypothetical protein